MSLTAKQLRFLFARGVLKGSGGGGKGGRTVQYVKSRARALKTARKHGIDVRQRYRNTPGPNAGRFAIGAKAAHLRKAGAPLSREQRIAAGRAIANRPDVSRRALKGSGLRVSESNRPDAARSPLLASGARASYKGDTRFLVRTARTEGRLKARWTGRPDYSATRAARIAAGRAIAERQRFGSKTGPQNPREQRVAEHLYARGILERNVVNGLAGARRYSGRSRQAPQGIDRAVWRKQWDSLARKKRLYITMKGDGNLF